MSTLLIVSCDKCGKTGKILSNYELTDPDYVFRAYEHWHQGFAGTNGYHYCCENCTATYTALQHMDARLICVVEGTVEKLANDFGDENMREIEKDRVAGKIMEDSESEESPFSFHWSINEIPTLESAVFQAIGAASTCWDNDRVFESDRALEIGRKLLEFITN